MLGGSSSSTGAASLLRGLLWLVMRENPVIVTVLVVAWCTRLQGARIWPTNIEWLEALRVSEVGEGTASDIVFGGNLDRDRVSSALVIGMVFGAILDGHRVLFAPTIRPPDRVSNRCKKTS